MDTILESTLILRSTARSKIVGCITMPASSTSLGGTMKSTLTTGLTAAMNYLYDDGNLTSDGLWDYVWAADGARERVDGADGGRPLGD